MHLIEDHISISYIFDMAEKEKKGESESAEDTVVLTWHTETYYNIYRIFEIKFDSDFIPYIHLNIFPDKPFPPPEYVA